MDAINAAVMDAASSPWIGLLLVLVCLGDSFIPAVPSESLVVAIGSLSASTGDPALWVIIPCAALGAAIGDISMYGIGRVIGTERFGWMRTPKVARVVAWARTGLDRRGALLILTGRNIPVVRVAVNLVAGATRYPPRRYLPLAMTACLMWAVYLAVVGAAAGRLTGDRPVVGAGIAIAVALVLGFGIDHVSRRLLGTPTDTESTEDTDAAADGADAPTLTRRGIG